MTAFKSISQRKFIKETVYLVQRSGSFMWEKAGSVNFSMKEVLIVRNQYNDLLCKLID